MNYILTLEGYKENKEIAALAYYIIEYYAEKAADYMLYPADTFWEIRVSIYSIEKHFELKPESFPVLLRFLKEKPPLTVFGKFSDLKSNGDYDPRKEWVRIDTKHIEEFIRDTVDGKKKANEPITREFAKIAIAKYCDSYIKDTIIHEFQHAYDDYRSGGKALKKSKRYLDEYAKAEEEGRYYLDDPETYKAYMKLPHEVWARFAEFIQNVYWTDDFSKVRKQFEERFRGYELLSTKMKYRLIKVLFVLNDLKMENAAKFRKELEKITKAAK